MATPQFICANWSSETTDCKKVGRYSCKNCLLVVYCGPNCQKSHWVLHKVDCKSPLGKETWQPDWALENRKPAFVRGGMAVQFGTKKFSWGNVPAFDILQLEANEGRDYGEKSHILFAASGDFRNVVKTIAQLPSSYNQPVGATMNDRDLDIVARNAIMLLIAFLVDDSEEAIDCIIHVWYSALIRKSDLHIIQQQVRPLIESVCNKTKNKNPDSILGKTWTFGQRSLNLVLEKSSWDNLLSFVTIPEGLTEERANKIRRDVTLGESRQDYRDRSLLLQSRSHRIAKNRFREDGLLSPFGSRRDDFRLPNPTLFQTADTWPMHDNADPLHGWPSKDVEDTSSGPATADIYGKLFYHIRAVLRAFLARLSNLQVFFRLFQVDAVELPNHLKGDSFSRIEVSNISDNGYLGIYGTIGLMVPLLQSPSINRHATLITLFMNAVDETRTQQDQMDDMGPRTVTTKRLLKYLPPKGIASTDISNPEIIKFTFARDSVANHEQIFDRFMKKLKFSEVAQLCGAEMNNKHTIIEKWPFRLKLRPGQPGAQEEFDRMLGGGVSGKERYVEWKRTYNDEDEIEDN